MPSYASADFTCITVEAFNIFASIGDTKRGPLQQHMQTRLETGRNVHNFLLQVTPFATVTPLPIKIRRETDSLSVNTTVTAVSALLSLDSLD